MEELNEKNALIERIFWLITLRWIAVVGVIDCVYFVPRFFNIPLNSVPLYLSGLALGAYNLVFFLLTVRLEKKPQRTDVSAPRIANSQISLDLLTLAVLLHFSGGIENPFIFYFIFHMSIAGILLSRKAAFLQATLATVLLILLGTLEYGGVLTHYSLKGFLPYTLFNNAFYVSGILFIFITTLYLTVYLTTSISRELREREKSLREANALLRENDRIKSEYVFRVSHDIKEHLGAIQNCLEPVTGRITGTLNDKQADLLQRADDRTGKLLFFVKSLLEVTRIKLRGEIKSSYFSFKEMLADSIAQISLKAKGKNISIHSTVEPTIDRIRGSEEYIQESIANLLANAVKYTPHNGTIDITVGDNGNAILVQIKDTGIGIPKNELPRIFEEFFRSSNAKKVERDGTGLGLSIVKQIIERHNGTIWVESEEGKGSTFYVTLPKS